MFTVQAQPHGLRWTERRPDVVIVSHIQENRRHRSYPRPNVGLWQVLLFHSVGKTTRVRQYSRPISAVDVQGTLPRWVALERCGILNLIAARPDSPYTHYNALHAADMLEANE